MKAILSRSYNKSETLGSLMIMDGERSFYNCKTIELPQNGNQRNTSCIPEGIYRVEKYTSPTKGECFHVMDVFGRDSILIHAGNYTKDTLGCILPGIYFTDLNADGKIDIAESRKALSQLLSILPDVFKLYIL